MNQRFIYRALLCCVAAIVAASCTCVMCAWTAETTPTRRPNVVVFLADDAGWGDYSYTGNRAVRTPRIDSLARHGVSLEQFFVCPLCSPTRAEFLTRRYFPRTSVYGVSVGQERLDPRERTIAGIFKAAGYATGCFGKWHNGSQWPYHPVARGFDEYFGHTAGHWGEYFDAPLEDSRGNWVRTRGYIVDVCTNRAIEFIEKNRDRPFFCFIPFTTPHSPWAVPEEYWQRFRHRPIEQRAMPPNRENIDETRCVLAMMENQDWNVGRVLQCLEQLGIAESTIVVYFSDNGPNTWRYNGGMKGRKGGLDEGSLRSVCFWRWNGKLPPGRRVPQITAAIDLLPTLASLAGIALPNDRPLDGCDLTPLLSGSKTTWPERLIFSSWNGRVSVRSQTHRLDPNGRLFAITVDPGQTQDRSGEEPRVAEALRCAVEQWRRAVLAREPSRELPRIEGVEKLRGIDPRPIGVGYPEFPITILPARDGQPCGGVKRSAAAPNCSYFIEWTDTSGEMIWLVDVRTAGRYRATMDFTYPVADVGATIELSFRESKLRTRISEAWDPPLYENQDTIARPAAESRMKEFRTMELGEITLPAGVGLLVLRAVDVPSRRVADVRRVTLELRENCKVLRAGNSETIITEQGNL